MLVNQLPPEIKYRVYASLLDSFSWYLKSEKEESEKEFIDKINRVPFSSEAADKGTAFNELIDSDLIEPVSFGKVIHNNFEFDLNLVKDVRDRVSNSVPQWFTSRILETSFGPVEIYGYIDYLLFDKAIDLKTTKEYDLGKYKDSWQRIAYPFCLAGEGITVNVFEFIVTDFSNVYEEPYPVDLWECESLLRVHVEKLIEFLNSRRSLITDKKIFNQLEEVAA